MKIRLSMLLSAAAALVLGACTTPSPQTRIADNPQLFAALSPAHKELVSQGRIDRGMSPEAVFLAWGRASSVYEGSRGNTPILRWDYAGSRPVETMSVFGGYGYGRFGRYGFGGGPEVAFVPYRAATVWFENQRVTSWERLR